MSFAQGSETFTNLDAPPAGGAYGDGSYIGDAGVTWTYVQAVTVTTTFEITGTSIALDRNADGGSVSAPSGVNGVGTLTYSIRSFNTGGTAAQRGVEVYVNGTLYDDYELAAMTTVFTRAISIQETGNVTIQFLSRGSRQVVIDDVSWTNISPCTTPRAQPTGLILSNETGISFDGNFTASSPVSDDYLVVVSTNNTLSANPVDGTAYAAGDPIGGGTVVASTGTTFTATGLSIATTYYVYIFSLNDECGGGPFYNTAVPLTGNTTTLVIYCNAGNTSSLNSEIENVELVGVNNSILNNTTDVCSLTTGGAPNDYTAMSADLESGSSYTLSVEFGDCDNATQLDGAAGVWIDWNNDGDFDDVNETIGVLDVQISLGNITQLFTINVPGAQANGNYTMRIVQEEGQLASGVSPCGTFTNGSVEDYTIEVISPCTPTQTITSFIPTSGPEGTEITITGTGFTAGSTVDFNGISATVTYVNTTTLIAEVPAGAITGAITVTESSCGLDSLTNFIIISGECIATSTPNFTNLLFSGVYDDQTDTCHYIELLNPTTTTISLSNYSIGVDNNFVLGSAPPTTGFGLSMPLFGFLSPGETLMIRLSDVGPCASCPTIIPDLSFSGGGLNADDRLVLLNGTTVQDVWQNHSNPRPGAGYNVGYVYSRRDTAAAPSATFDLDDWDSDGNEDCFGFEISIAPSPTINTQPVSIINECNELVSNIVVTAEGTGTLSYQWKYNDGTFTGWNDVTTAAFSPGIVSGETTAALNITGFNLDNYQFYCEVTETGLCAIGTNAIQVDMPHTTWNGSAWSNGIPDINTMAIINDDYSTTLNGNFSACSLIINSTFRLTVNNASFVEIENNTLVDGELYVETHGAFVQNNNDSRFDVSAIGTSLVNKLTTPLNDVYEYTFWSSPVTNSLVQNALAPANPGRRFWFNAANFLDEFIEINNSGTFIPGSDGIDDDGNDWTLSNGTDIMTPGVGYNSTHSPVGFVVGNQYQYTFEGPFNNGLINASILYNGANGDEDWNLLGNPYPCAIDAISFLNDNVAVIGGAIYLWSQSTPANSNTSGNEGVNFAQGDYAIITNGSGNTAGGDMVIPNNYVPSGQSFFVQGLANGNAVYSNAHRMADGTSNGQFFRTRPSNANRIWVNLTSDNGVFNQILVAYVDGATNLRDNMSYDAKASIHNLNAAVIYTKIENDNDRFTIQGKAPESITINEVIPVGFETVIEDPTIYSLSIAQLEGEFFINNTVYLKDKLLNVFHDLSTNEYVFTSAVGGFEDRFEILFRDEVLSSDNQINEKDISIIELQDNNIKFSVKADLSIESVRIIDLLGREVNCFQGSKSQEICNIPNLSNATYIARIELSNGQIFNKKIIKK